MMDGFDFEVQVNRTDRKKSASIEVENNQVVVTVPASVSDSRIRELVSKRTAWIKTKLKEEISRPPPKPKEFVSGETLPYLGKNYRLKVQTGSSTSVGMYKGYLVVEVPDEVQDRDQTIRSLLEGWYQSHAEKRLKEKTDRFSEIVGVTPKSVSVCSYKSRWGSCSVSGDLSYNWRIILAPHRIVDYVVVHELCHLLEHNHSPRYWKHVAHHVPEYKDCREWLKHNELMI